LKTRDFNNDKRQVRAFWSVFPQLHACDVDEITELDLWFDGEHLLVDQNCAANADFLERVSTLIMAISKITVYTSSRMLSQGEACSGLTGAQCIGLDRWFETAVAVDNSDWHIKGYGKRMAMDLRVHCSIATLLAPIGNIFVRQVFDDDRLLRHPEYETQLIRNMKKVSQLDPIVFERFSSGPCKGHISAVDLMDETLMAVNTFGAYMWLYTFKVLKTPPWIWTQGDVEANLRAAQGAPKPRGNLTAAKIWTMLNTTFALAFVVEAVMALINVSFASHIVEQFHAPSAMMMKEHGRYGAETLLARSVVYLLYAMMTALKDRKLDTLQAALARARNRHTSVNAFAMFIRDATTGAFHAGLDAGDGLALADDTALRVDELRAVGVGSDLCMTSVPRFAAYWRSASRNVRDTYADMARQRSEDNYTRKNVTVQRLREEIRQHHVKTLSEEDAPLCRASSCKFPAASLKTMEDMFTGKVGNFSRKHVLALRGDVSKIPDATERALQEVYEGIGCPEFTNNKLDATTWKWARPMALNRKSFRRCAMLLGPMGEHGAWMFALGPQSPTNVVMTRLRFKARQYAPSAAALESVQDFWEEDVDNHDWLFETDFEYDDATTIVVPPLVSWYVLPGMTWTRNTTLFSDLDPIAFDVFIQDFGKKVADEDDGGDDEGDVADDPPGGDTEEGTDLADILTLFPWAAERVLERSTAEPKSKKPKNDDVERRVLVPDAAAAREGLSDDDIAGILARVAAKRLELNERCVGPHNEFKVVPRGGPNTFLSSGLSIDGIRGQGSSAESVAWCDRCNLQKTVTFAVELYTMQLAQDMATAWCHKMNYYWGIYVDSGRHVDYVYTAADRAGYAELPAWKIYADNVQYAEPGYVRVNELRMLEPW
jgi:hypothetical protein